MSAKRVTLYDRLPEIYRIKDAEQAPSDQLRSYLALVEDAFGAIHANIESLYHDLFVETSDAWAIPYIGDLLGVSHLSGETQTLRADVADTIALRRRKGTLGAIELLTYNLTRWGVHCVELRELLVWNQHLNHQRPAEGGMQPYGAANSTLRRQTPIRGGTVTLRDPATLSLLGTPFDRFAHIADLRSPMEGGIHYNLPNLALFLWRLEAYRLNAARPVYRGTFAVTGGAAHAARFNINPIEHPYLAGAATGRRVRLFNTHHVDLLYRDGGRQDPSDGSITISRLDEAPGPIPMERLGEGTSTGAPEEYLAVTTYTPGTATIPMPDGMNQGLVLHLPLPEFFEMVWPTPEGGAPAWKIRGENLCAWESGINPPLEAGEIAIDPVLGRIVIGEDDAARASALESDLLVTHTYGTAGPVGAHPVSRDPLPAKWQFPSGSSNVRRITARTNPMALRDALKTINLESRPVVIEIADSLTHEIDLTDPAYVNVRRIESGHYNLELADSLVIRAADGERPIIRLKQPLRFRPKTIDGSAASIEMLSKLTVRLEGLVIVRADGFGANDPLVARAPLNQLEIIGCTLDPGGFLGFDGQVAPVQPAMILEAGYGLPPAELFLFGQTPRITLERTITGPLWIDPGYELTLASSIVDAGQGVAEGTDRYALGAATDQINGWGPPTRVDAATFLGRVRVERMSGGGGIWVHALQVLDNQYGCIRYSYFSGEAADRLPQNHACVKGTDAPLRFTSEQYGQPGYCQLARISDFRIRERGPGDDAMGAFGFLLEAHKWRNLSVRYREFMPVGVRPLLIPVT